ncbi:MAG: carbon storage regulator CsrA [Armatimonadetes bacterium]|nr:carbon storage regulator CsrA [Armatimonadota bacterium]MDW8153985.1 carbon storage regulator CsrA [Armatimonadota bacterium]
MLVLTRKLNEAIRIGQEVEVRVLGIEGGQVRLGITAPRWIPVHREEVYREIQRENQEATQAGPEELRTVLRPTASAP